MNKKLSELALKPDPAKDNMLVISPKFEYDPFDEETFAIRQVAAHYSDTYNIFVLSPASSSSLYDSCFFRLNDLEFKKPNYEKAAALYAALNRVDGYSTTSLDLILSSLSVKVKNLEYLTENLHIRHLFLVGPSSLKLATELRSDVDKITFLALMGGTYKLFPEIAEFALKCYFPTSNLLALNSFEVKDLRRLVADPGTVRIQTFEFNIPTFGMTNLQRYFAADNQISIYSDPVGHRSLNFNPQRVSKLNPTYLINHIRGRLVARFRAGSLISIDQLTTRSDYLRIIKASSLFIDNGFFDLTYRDIATSISLNTVPVAINGTRRQQLLKEHNCGIWIDNEKDISAAIEVLGDLDLREKFSEQFKKIRCLNLVPNSVNVI